MTSLEDLNQADDRTALDYIAPLIERAPEVAKRVVSHRPFRDLDALTTAIHRELVALSEADSIALFCAHPELAPDNPLTMTAESQVEQARFDLISPKSEYRDRLASMNAAYRQRFGFPFITALVRHADMGSVMAEFSDRLKADRASEIRSAIEQIATVSAARVRALFRQSSKPDIFGKGDVMTRGTRHAS